MNIHPRLPSHTLSYFRCRSVYINDLQTLFVSNKYNILYMLWPAVFLRLDFFSDSYSLFYVLFHGTLSVQKRVRFLHSAVYTIDDM